MEAFANAYVIGAVLAVVPVAIVLAVRVARDPWALRGLGYLVKDLKRQALKGIR